jgi:hypothetical protein
VNLGGLDGDESDEPRPLLHVSLGECQAPGGKTTRTYHPNRCHGGGNDRVFDTSFEASSAPMLLPFRNLKAGSRKWIHSTARCGPRNRYVRAHVTGRNIEPETETKMRSVFTSRSSFNTFNTVLSRFPHKIRQHVVPIAYISHL